MLSNGSVERNDVGNWEIGSEEPNCAYNARALASPFFDAAVGEDRENAQTENRQIFREPRDGAGNHRVGGRKYRR